MSVTTFIAPKYRVLLEYNKLAGFEQAWDYEASWVEAPNNARGGLSGVGRVTLHQQDGTEFSVFLKRQQNHTRKTWRHPWRGEATFSREFRIIMHLQQHGVPTLQPLLFGEHYGSDCARAVLLTAELDGYQSLEEFVNEAAFQQLPLRDKRRLLGSVAETVRQMHEAGVQHRSLYAKHLFVKQSGEGYQVAIIDLEKSRVNLLPLMRQFYDLVTLNYRTPTWSQSNRLYFFKKYCGVQKLGFLQKALCRLIIKRSKNKSMQENN